MIPCCFTNCCNHLASGEVRSTGGDRPIASSRMLQAYRLEIQSESKASQMGVGVAEMIEPHIHPVHQPQVQAA